MGEPCELRLATQPLISEFCVSLALRVCYLFFLTILTKNLTETRKEGIIWFMVLEDLPIVSCPHVLGQNFLVRLCGTRDLVSN